MTVEEAESGFLPESAITVIAAGGSDRVVVGNKLQMLAIKQWFGVLSKEMGQT